MEQLVEVGIAFQGKLMSVRGKVYKKRENDGKWVEESKYDGIIKGTVEDEGDEIVGDNDNDL